jgi:hypothetical protein
LKRLALCSALAALIALQVVTHADPAFARTDCSHVGDNAISDAEADSLDAQADAVGRNTRAGRIIANQARQTRNMQRTMGSLAVQGCDQILNDDDD